MKLKLSLICTMLILVLCIGAVSAADIDAENELSADDTLLTTSDLDEENDYVSDENMVVNDSDSSQLLGVSENEDLIGDGTFSRIEFKDAVDGVITFSEAEEEDYDDWGYSWNNIYFNVYDENNNIIILDETNCDYDFGGYSWNKDKYKINCWDTDEENECQFIEIDSAMYFAEIPNYWELTKYGTYEFVIYNADRTFSQAVTIVLVDHRPKEVTATYSVGDVITVDVTSNDGPGNFTVYLDDEVVANGLIDDEGKGSASFEKSKYGFLNLKVILDGATTSELTYETTIELPKTSQWGNTGFDIKNSGNTNYTRLDNAYIIWSNNETINFTKYPANKRVDYDGKITYSNNTFSPIIDSDGNIYVNDGHTIFLFDNNGNLISSKSPGRIITGLTIYHDRIIVTPRSDEEIYTYEFSTGKSYTGETSWVSSSLYYPIIGPDERIYVSSLFNNLNNNGNWVTVLNYDEDESFGPAQKFNWNSALISSKPISTPVFDDNNIMWVATEKGICAANITSGVQIFSEAGIGIVTRPVIDNANLIYYIGTDNKIYALTLEGYKWNTTVTGGTGTTLAVDNENGILYAVNGEGKLYKYATDNGAETLVDDVGSTAESIIIDGNSNVYVATDNGGVYAFDSEGQKLWTINLGSSIAGQMAMDKNGVIYAVTADTIYALGYKNDTDLSLEVEDNFTTLDEITITASINSTFDGENITFTIKSDNGYENTTNESIADGKAILNIANLKEGTYNVTASYAGNTCYAEASIDDNFTVSKVTPELSVNINNGTTLKNATITVTSTNCKGTVSVKVGDETFDDVEIDEEYILPILPVNVYDVTVTYAEDDVFTEAVNDTEKLEYVKEEVELNPEISIEDNTVIVKLPENATGNIFLDVDGIGYYAPIKDGEAVINIPELKPGIYEAKLNYPGDENYNNASAIFNIEVPELQDPELEVSVDETEITVNINENATGVIIVSIGDISFIYDAEDAPITIDVSEYLDAGKYDVTVEYIGDENFAEASANDSVTVPDVELKDPELEVSVKDTEITVTIDKDATGIIIVSVGDNDYVADAADAPITIDVSNLEPDAYDVDVIYLGDENFTEAKANATVTVPEEPVVEPKDPELKLNIQNTTIAVSINENATGDVIITVGDISFVQYASELTPIDVSEYLSSGKYSVTVRYVGDENFEESAVIGGSVTVPEEPVVEPKDPNLKATATNTTISVSVDKDATGNVLVDVDGQGYYAPVKDGKASVNVIGLDEGEYKATVTYVGDEVYKADNTTVTVTVPKKEDPTPEPVDPKAEIEITNATVSITAPKDATGYLLVDVDGTGYYAPIKDGKATIDLPELEAGNHTITAAYTGDNKYTQANKTETITIDEEIETIIAEDLTKVEKAPERFEAKFTDADGKALANTDVTFTINGQTYTRTTDANGETSIAINLIAGNYTITVNNPVTKETKEYKITVLSRFAENKDLTKYFRNASQFIVKILDDNGNPAKEGEIVTFNINGVFYNRTADATGHVQLNINLQPGDYIITSQYKGCEVSNKVKVLPILTGKDLTKKYGEKDVFEATLVDGQGKPYANQEISFNINGVFYVRTTDSNGVAKLNINLQPGEYIITSTYGQTATSNKVTVTA